MGKQTIGYKYFIGAHMVWCHGPVDSISKVMVDDKVVVSNSVTSSTTLPIDRPTFFGDEKMEGGLKGSVDVMFGEPSQGTNGYLLSVLPDLATTYGLPAFRGVVSFVLRQFYVGNSPYLKPWSIKATRILKRSGGATMWYPEKAAIGTDMNPAHIIYDVLTDADWGMGYGVNDINDANFRAAADTLYAEGLGMSILWDSGSTLEDFIKLVEKHVDGMVNVNRTTGKFEIKLVRNDYDPNTLLTLGESEIKTVSSYSRVAPGDLINRVTVVYEDPDGKDATVTVDSLALIEIQGRVVSAKENYPGFSTHAAAAKTAERLLRVKSTPLLACKLTVTRAGAGLLPGSVFKLNWPRLGVTSSIMRVTSVSIGTLSNNEVTVECTEDIFAAGQTIYTTPTISGWQPIDNTPLNVTTRLMVEAPFWEVVQSVGAANALALPATSGYAVITGVRPSSAAINAKLASNASGAYATTETTVDFCPNATLTGAMSKTDTVIPLSGADDLDLVNVGEYAMIDSEIVVIKAISDTSMTIGRGCLDTVPATHLGGTRVFFCDAFFDSDKVEYTSGETARYKLLTVTGEGELAVGSASESTAVIAGRAAKPYPPGLFKVNGQSYPAVAPGVTTITWAHRDRTLVTTNLIDTTYGNVGPESGVTYTVAVYDQNGTFQKSASGISSTSYAMDMSSIQLSATSLRVTVSAVRSGLTSFQSQEATYTPVGYGMAYGTYYGGI